MPEFDLYAGLTEEQKVLRRRFREAQAAGLTRGEAAEFAFSDIDIGELRKLVEKEFPPRLLADTLL